MTAPNHFYDLPRAGIDPINTPQLALSLIDMIRGGHEARNATFVITLDADWTGHSIVEVTDTTEAAHVVDVVSCIVDAVAVARRADTKLVLASQRVGCVIGTLAEQALMPSLVSMCKAADVELVDWFVIAGSSPVASIGMITGLNTWPS